MIVRSLIENDTYKWNISYFYMKNYPFAEIEFEFFDRQRTPVDQDFVDQFNLEFAKLTMLKPQTGEKEFMIKSFYWLPKWFFDWYFAYFRFKTDCVQAFLREDSSFGCKFFGAAAEKTFYEMPVLMIFTALMERYRGMDTKVNMKEVEDIAMAQIELSNNHKLYFSEFGMRRRFSANVQDFVDKLIVDNAKYCIGNSNCYLAFKLGQKVSGTMAHEVQMMVQAFHGYVLGGYHTAQQWMNTFNGDVGILLPDTIGRKQFLNNLTKLQAKACDGFRHDSGPWEDFTTDVIRRLNELNVDPRKKTFVYSDSINMFTYDDIHNNVQGRVGFDPAGIGGAWTNNTGLDGAKVECVCKMTRTRINKTSPWRPTVKVPDTDGKYMGDKEEIKTVLRQCERMDELKRHFPDA